ncbi:MAG: hypothetical protein ACYC5K_06450 [Saccharofermentanales bacterium]
MKKSMKHHILALLIPILLIMVSASVVVLTDHLSAVNAGTKVANSEANEAAVKAPAIVVIPAPERPQVTDIRKTFVLGFFILILLTVSLVFVFSFSY